MKFSGSTDSNFNKIYDSHISEFSENIIILKRVNSIRQLKNAEKELVRLCYKEAVLKGLGPMNHIQSYIASKTKIWIERSGIEYLRKSEEEENKKWYFNLAKDHFAYIGVYRKTFDELEQCKKELWGMISEPETSNSEKIQMLRELHNLSKTSILLLRDLPFISNLSKYYDLDFFDMNSNSQKPQNLSNGSNNEDADKQLIDKKVSERLKKMFDESALFNSEQKRKMGAISSPPSTNGDKNIDDDIMQEIQKQLDPTSEDILESINNKDYQESLRKIKEIMED